MTELRKYWKERQREHRMKDMKCPDCTNYDKSLYPSPCKHRTRWCTLSGFCVHENIVGSKET